MHPVLFTWGSLTIYSYGMLLALAFLVGILTLLHKGKKRGIDHEKLLNLVIVILVAALVGSRAAYILLWDLQNFLREPPLFFDVERGGLSFHGGFLLAAAAGILYSRSSGLPVGTLADISAPLVALGYAVSRVGCLLNGCCAGRVVHVSWSLLTSQGYTFFQHPTQLYGVAAGLAIYAILTKQKSRFPGHLMLSLVALYSTYRFIVDFFREEARVIFDVFTLGQITSIILLGASLFLLYRLLPGRDKY